MRKLFSAIASVGLLLASVAAAQAETCYRLNPFSDVLRVNIRSAENHHALTGNWVSPSYSLPISGAREINHAPGTLRRVGIVGTNNTGLFSGHVICAVDGVVNGPWKLQCTGNNVAPFANNGSPLAQVSCAGVAPALNSRLAGGAH